ncbi:MAG: PspC domain-containing protein [Burkholderiales bacterium]|nr:PspC domain-containing protein [Burkholderiales bacterium]
MSLSEELDRLGALHDRGQLSDEEFVAAKARVLRGEAPGVGPPALQAINALRRSRDDRWLGGVCGGIARVTGVQSWIWRLMFTLLAICAGTGVLVYLLMWILVPTDPPPSTPGSHPQAPSAVPSGS